MEAPEKIYVIEQEAARGTILLASAELNDFAKQNNAKEYTRADAFIEKACEYLNNSCRRFILTEKDIEDFKNYMKGE